MGSASSPCLPSCTISRTVPSRLRCCAGRQAFLNIPASFFYRDGEPVRAEESPSLFRQGMLRIARATGTEEKKWLAEAIGSLEG